MLSSFSLLGIRAYQSWISPYKGYRCAYSILHGGTGCSGFAKQEIQRNGIKCAMPKIRSRFADCRLALETLQTNQHEAQSGPDKKKKGTRECDWSHLHRCSGDPRMENVDCCPGNADCCPGDCGNF
ncbi:membrane protein insertion efficiency factor YidD [Parasedimentitalea denitrificans]